MIYTAAIRHSVAAVSSLSDEGVAVSSLHSLALNQRTDHVIYWSVFRFRTLSHIRRGPEPGNRDAHLEGSILSLRGDLVSSLNLAH